MIEIDYPEEEHREATSGQTTLLQVLEKKILSGPYQTELKTSIFETYDENFRIESLGARSCPQMDKKKTGKEGETTGVARLRSKRRVSPYIAAMNEIYRWLISEQRGDGCLHECGWVQRKTNRAYRIDRRNPEHVRRLSCVPSTPLSFSLSLPPFHNPLRDRLTERERNSSSTRRGVRARADATCSLVPPIRVETLHSYPPVRRPSDRRA